MNHFKIHNIAPYVSKEVQMLCVKPYPGHRHGCPNWNGKDGCPPHIGLLDVKRKYRVLYHSFDFASHIESMAKSHPEWSEKQTRCCLYWQPKARKQFRQAIEKEFLISGPQWAWKFGMPLSEQERAGVTPLVVWVPEAHGVAIMKLCREHDVFFEWPPRNVATLMILMPLKDDEE